MHNSSNGNKEQDNNQKEPAILIVADMYRTPGTSAFSINYNYNDIPRT